MTARSALTAVRSIIIGLASLAVILFVENWLLRWSGPLLGPAWLPTAQTALECAALFTAGWLIGRWGWPGVVLLAVAIALLRLNDLFWLFRLFVDCFENSRYWASFLNSFGIHILLVASLFAGANWSRPREVAALRIK